MPKHFRPRERGLFDQAMRLEELHALGDPLARLDEVVDWSVFDTVWARRPKPEPKGPGGRPSFAPALMFKALVIAHLYQLSDAQLEFQITDRLSFKRFLGLTEADASPDEKTFWAFRESLHRHDLFGPLFAAFRDTLKAKGMIARQGQIIDASFVAVPRQRNSREENAQIKAGVVPPAWQEQPHKLRQKDVDARWTRKHEQRYYGYKNHVKVDSRSKLIDAFTVTDAAVHDSQAVDSLVVEGDPVTYVDSAYAGEPCAQVFAERKVKVKPIQRAYRNKPLNGTQVRLNRARAKVRARVEHVFGTMRMSMRSAWNRCLGLVRNRGAITMTNLVYNLIRFEQIERLGLKNWRAA
jgi:transposase, IS5 family